jgi:hypothetical protein
MVTPVISALIGLGGVILGAVATLLSPALADSRQARGEARRWRRDQLANAYEQALRYLLRAANRRSEFQGGRGGAVLNRQHQREWFDDIVEAQLWLRTVTRYCDPAQLDRIRQTAEHLDKHVSRLVSGERFDRKDFSIWKVLQSCIATVTDCARLDGGTSISVSNDVMTDMPVASAIEGRGQYANIAMDTAAVQKIIGAEDHAREFPDELLGSSICLPDDLPREEREKSPDA